MVAQGPAGEADGVGGGPQVAGHEREVGGLDRHVGPGPDRQAEIRLGERRRVVDAVADHRDDARPRPGASARRRPCRPAARRRSPRRSPTCPATAPAVVSLSPVRRIGRSPSPRRSAIASMLLGLTVSATARMARTSPSQATGDRGAALFLRRREGGLQLGVRAAGPGRRAGPGGPRRPHARRRRPRLRGPRGFRTPRPREHARPFTRGGGDRAGDRDARRRPRARRRGAAASASEIPGAVDQSDQRHLPGGHGSGLVEHDRVDPPCGLEHLRALDQQPELCAAARPDEQRRRRREPEGAGAGDDQDGDGRRERGGGRRPRGQPGDERDDGEHDDDRDEDRRDAVREALDGRLARSAPR